MADWVRCSSLAALWELPNRAAPGHYRHAETGMDMLNPEFLVTWDIHRTQGNAAEGQHEWWEWLPNTVAPQVGSGA